MVKTYKDEDGIIFKGLQYTGKNLKEFYDALNNQGNEMGINVNFGTTTPVIEDSNGIEFLFSRRAIRLEKGDYFLYSRDTAIFAVYTSKEVKEELKQVK